MPIFLIQMGPVLGSDYGKLIYDFYGDNSYEYLSDTWIRINYLADLKEFQMMTAAEYLYKLGPKRLMKKLDKLGIIYPNLTNNKLAKWVLDNHGVLKEVILKKIREHSMYDPEFYTEEPVLSLSNEYPLNPWFDENDMEGY